MSSFSSVKLELSLAPFVLALPLAMDIYVPAIPGLTQIFNISDKIMLLTLSIFMLTAGLMQLIIGPLSEAVLYAASPLAINFLYLAASSKLLVVVA